MTQILLIEDSRKDADIFETALKLAQLEYELHTVEDGESAIHWLVELGDNKEVTVPDLIVIDLNLPHFNGLEILNAIRQLRPFDDCPVVILSSSDTRAQRETADLLGAVLYLQKPMDLDETAALGAAIKSVLEVVPEIEKRD